VSRKTIRILLVDDEADHVELIRRSLNGASFEAELSVTGSLAGAQAFLRENTPDIVITAYRLPDGSGLKLLPGDVEKRTIPIIFFTRYGDEKVAAEALKAGALDYIVKSDDTLKNISHFIERSLREWEYVVVRRKAESQLIASEKKYKSLIESMTEGVALHEIIYDLNDCPVDYRILNLNPAFERQTGISEASAKGRLASKLYGTSGAPFLDQYEKVARTGEPCSFETYFPPLQKHFEISVFSPKQGQFATVFSDITERKQGEEARARIQTLLDQASDLVFLCDNHGVVLYVNRAVERMTGLKPEEIIGKPFSPLFDEHCESAVKEGYHTALKGETKAFELAFKTTGICCEYRMQPYKDAEGNVIGMLGSARDITEHKRMEAELKEERALAHAYLDIAGVMMVALDTRGDISLINEKGRAILGYDEQEAIGKNWFDLCVPELVRKDVKRVFKQLMAGDVAADEYYENKLLTKTGEERIIAFHNSVLKDDNGISTGILFSGEDITERKEAEAALLASEDKFRSAVMNSPFPNLIHAEDGEIISVSQRWCEITGYSPDELQTIGDWTELAYGERKEVVLAEIDSLYKLNSRKYEGDFSIRSKTGEILEWEFSSAPLGILPDGRRLVISMALDVTERRKIDSELRASEKAFRSTFNQAAVGIAHVAFDGGWVQVNDRLCEIVGYSRDELMLLTLQDITHPDDLEIDLKHVNELLAGDIQHYSMEKRYIRKSGENIWINLTASLVRQEDGSPDYFIAVVEDIEERKHAERALKESESTFRGLAETLQMAIYISTGEDQVCEYINPRFIELFGYTRDEVPSVEKWWPLAYPDATYRQRVADDWQAKVKKAIETHSSIEPVETVVSCKDGSKKTISWGLVSVGELNYAIGVDLTAQRQAEHELKERFDEIERMNKLMIGRELKMEELRQEIRRLKDVK